ncbi:hypothetical protein, partial [Caballeronia sp. AAUFL_F1_KS45]|uniref:hypothetical protein n=1 Tax=Caballeronia sp. AAUFL_F1_KS45 TaxID=2921770 RepID=UPI00202782F1
IVLAAFGFLSPVGNTGDSRDFCEIAFTLPGLSLIARNVRAPRSSLNITLCQAHQPQQSASALLITKPKSEIFTNSHYN